MIKRNDFSFEKWRDILFSERFTLFTFPEGGEGEVVVEFYNPPPPKKKNFLDQ